MAQYDFHYLPLEGKITGKQVLQQTEDAINDLGNRIVGVETDTEAIAEAVEIAQDAKNTADNAETIANDAMDVAQAERESAQEAAQEANQAATNAANSASSASVTATQLMEYLATKEEITAPAVDPTLTFSGAAADAKETGVIFNSLNSILESKVSLSKIDALCALRKVTASGTQTEDANGTRIRVVFNCSGYSNIHFYGKCTYGSGIAVAEYSTISEAVYSGTNYIQAINGFNYSNGDNIGIFTVGGFISVSIKKSDGSVFSDQDKADALSALQVSIYCQSLDSKRIADIEENLSNYVPLRVGELVNGHLTASGVVDDRYAPYRLSTKEVVAFPRGTEKIKVKINKNYNIGIRVGATSTSLLTNLFWLGDGDTIDIPAGNNYYAVSIGPIVGDADRCGAVTLTPADVDDIGLQLLVKDNGNVVAQNSEACNILSSARLFFSTSEPNTLYKYPVIAHTSDCHGDYTRVERFFQFCDTCKIDAACVTGDIVSYKPSQQIKWFQDIVKNHITLPAICIGNHDVYDNAMDDTDIYDFVFGDIAAEIGNTTGKTWYYTDIADKKLRIISVNLYQYGGTNRWYTHFTDEQLAWIVSTLASTPNDYGVIILTHAPQVGLNANAKDPNYPTFFQDVRLYNNPFNDVNGTPLYDIVDAFISRTTLTQTYTQTGSPASVSVSADFTSVDSSVEFIAHLTGHFHQDTICYVPNRTNKQLMLNVTCTNAIYGGSAYPYLADVSDQGRNNTDSSQDAFNVYVIDRDNKVVKVVRVGSNMTYQMAERKYMAIPYAD